MNADVQLDPEGEDLPWNHIVEICTINDDANRWPLREAAKERGTLVKELANVTWVPGASQGAPDDEDDPTIFELISQGPELQEHIEKATDFLKCVPTGYKKDKLFSKIVIESSQFPTFHREPSETDSPGEQKVKDRHTIHGRGQGILVHGESIPTQG